METSSEFFTFTSVGYFIVLGIIPTYILWKTPIKKTEFSKQSLFKTIGFFTPILLFFGGVHSLRTKEDFSNLFMNDQYKQLAPYNFIRGTIGYLKKLKKKRYLDVAKLTKIEKQHSFDFSQVGDETIVVLVIGESARGGNFQLNGYHKETNPYTSSMENLINFGIATSCSTLTVVSIPCMISPLTRDEFSFSKHNHSSIVSIFKDNGFDTGWYSMQSYTNKPSECLESDVCKQLYEVSSDYHMPTKEKKLDDNMLVHYLNDQLNSNSKSKFIALQLVGSHFDYDKRYPDEFREFQPVCKLRPNLCEKEALLNGYDNSIRYIDYVISNMIKELENHNAILIYTSDHGESLGENEVYFHGLPLNKAPKEQTEVPFMLWASQKYVKNNSDKYHALKANSKQNVSHDNLFHTILGCIGVQSKVIDDELNLCHLPHVAAQSEAAQ